MAMGKTRKIIVLVKLMSQPIYIFSGKFLVQVYVGHSLNTNVFKNVP